MTVELSLRPWAGIGRGNRYEIVKTSTTDLGRFLVAWTAYSAILWVVPTA
ncbi:MAG: hypothetical protein H7Z12_17850 [Rhodospirillaceae bacterium]|nr:hypothetical protein [Rhodospirillales bacterium]